MSQTFTYRAAYGSDIRTSVLSRERAERLADAFEANGMGEGSYPFNRISTNDSPRRFEQVEALLSLVVAEGLDLGDTAKWIWDVDAVMRQRGQERRRLERVAAAEAQQNPAVRAYLVEQASALNGRFEIKPDSLAWMCKAATEDRRRETTINGKKVLLGPTPYQPKGGCGMRLKLAEAVRYRYRQEAYADHQEWVVPVEGAPEDVAVCRDNLYRFAEALRTTNGLAGYGSSYSFSMVQTAEGWVVVVDQRSSIAD